MAKVPLPSYHPDQLGELVGNENTELPDDVVEAMLNIMRAYADPEFAPYIGYYTPAQIEYYSSQPQPHLTPLPENRDILHIHNLCRHWITTFYSAERRTVYICDSLKTPSHTQQIEKQVKMIYGNLSRNIEHVDVVQQNTQPICGPLAIAFAVAYYLRTDPAKLHFDLSKVSKHLKTCIQLGTVTQFPTVNTDEHLLSSYFATQLEMQQKKSDKKVENKPAVYNKHEKKKLQKEIDRERKRENRLRPTNDQQVNKTKNVLTETKENTESSELRQKHTGDKNVLRKRTERINKPECENNIDKEKNLTKRTERTLSTESEKRNVEKENGNRTQLQKRLIRENNVLRKRKQRMNKPESEKDFDKQKDLLRKRMERANRKETEKDTQKEKDKLRKKTERTNRTIIEKDTQKEKDKLRKKTERTNRTIIEKDTQKEKDKLRKKTETANRTEIEKAAQKEKDITRKKTERANKKATEKDTQKEKDKLRKKTERTNRTVIEKDTQKEKDKLRKKTETANRTEIEKGPQKEKDKLRKKTETANRTEIEKGAQKEKDITRKKTERANRTEIEKDTQKEKDKLRKKTETANRTEIEKGAQKEKDIKRKKTERANRTENEKGAQNEKDIIRKKTERANRTEIEKDTQKEKDKLRKKTETANRTEIEKGAQKEKDITRKKTERANRTETEKKTMNRKDSVCKKNKRKTKSDCAKEIDKQKDSARKRTKRLERTDSEKEFSRDIDACRKRSKRHEKSSIEKNLDRDREKTLRTNKRNPTSIETCIINFKQAIKDGALYVCISCVRLMFRRSVIKYVSSKYKNKELIRSFESVTTEHGANWICQTCDSALKRNKIPPLCSLNHLSLENIPKELDCLTSLELQLVSQILPFMKVLSLHTGAQHKLSGQVVLVPTDLSKVSTSLPRNTASAQIITLALKRRLSDKHAYHKQIIRPSHVNEAISYLKSNSQLYSEVQVNSNWEQESAEQSSQLWSAVNPQNTANSSNSQFTTDDSFEQLDSSRNNQSENTAPVQDQILANDTCEITDSEDEVDCENPIEVQEELQNKASLNASTCLQPINGPEVQSSSILNIAPAEGQIPTTYFKQPEWETLCFPKLFPTGLNTFNTDRPVKLSLKKYFNQRLTNKDTRFSECTEYIFQALDATEREQIQNSISLTTRKTIQNDISAGHLKDPDRVTRLISTDQMFTSFKNIRATPQYWQQMQLDMLSKLRQLGPYTFFLTASAAEFHWTEVIQVVAKQYGTNLSDQEIQSMDWNTKRSWLQRNPVTVARQIDYIFEQLFTKVILSGAHPIGQILNYDKRKEMQGRGTEHFHSALHVKDAPKLDVNTDKECIQFIDKYITCEMPELDHDEELNSLVQRQVHHHTKSCKKNKDKACRYGYPRAPSPQTLIARVPECEDSGTLKADAGLILRKLHGVLTSPDTELSGNITLDAILKKAGVSKEMYISALQVAQRRTTVVMKRSPQELMVNNYNKNVLRALRANMDIQFITNIWACIAYLTSYICKPERTMSEMMKKASKEANSKPVREALSDIGHVFIKSREVSEHEAISRVLSLPLRKSNIDVQFIQTDIPENRTRILKPRPVLEHMEDDETDIYIPSIHDKYASRPNSLEGICLADFVSKFTIGSQVKKDEEEDHKVESDPHAGKKYYLKNNMGMISKRSSSKVIRYHTIPKQRDEEMYYHRLLILYLPWRSEEELLLDDSYQKKFQDVKDIITQAIQIYEPYNDEVTNTLENFDPDEAGPEIWTEIGVNAQQEADYLESGATAAALPLLDPDNLEACLVESETQKKTQSSYSFTVTNLLPETDFLARVRNLNHQQRALFDFFYTWATNKRLQSDSTEPFHIFLTGGAGCGKTFLINTLYEGLVRALRTPGQDPEKPTVLMTASTGKAASNINGMTLHSAFGLPVKKHKSDTYFSYKPPSQSRLNTMRCNFVNLKVIICDEISMSGSTTFQNHLSCALQEIFQNYSEPFAGLSVLAVGDLLQLNPVGQNPVFSLPTHGYDALAGSVWQKHFKLYELTAIVRQKGDPRFAEILNNVRVGTLTKEDEQDLKNLENTDTTNFPQDTIHLFRTNELADIFNKEQLKSLPEPHFVIHCQDTKKDLHTNSVPVAVNIAKSIYETGGLPTSIEIAVGAPFMITKNIDTGDHLVNGVIGQIQHIDLLPNKPLQGCIYLKFDKPIVGKELKRTSPSGLRNLVPIRAVSSTFFITEKTTVPVERKMFPGVLAYALTVHKSQGSTYTHLIADFKKPGKAQKMATPQGLAYTMLSRATSRAGIQVLNFDNTDITINKKALDEMTRMRTQSTLDVPLSLDENDVHIGHINIRSLNKHACDLISDPTVQQMTVLCLTETKMRSTRKETLMPGYKMVLDNSSHGLAIFIKQDSTYTTLNFSDSDIEILGITLQSHQLTYHIIVVYKPPTYPVQRFLNSLEACIRGLQHLLILGDFNQTRSTNIFNDFLSDNGFLQYITAPTHSLGDTLDLVISPIPNLLTITKALPYTDHHLTAVKLTRAHRQGFQ